MKDNAVFILFAAVGTAATVGMYLLAKQQVEVLSEPVCLYIDEYGYCYQTRIY